MPDETDIIISELSNAPQIDDSAVFPLTQDNGGSPATFKATMSQIAGKIGEGTTFANLHTTSKTLVGALNELKDGGGGSTEIIGTASGSIATFADGGNGIPLKSCEVAIVAQQASGTPSPSNPLSITGFSSIDVSVSNGVDTPTVHTVPLGQTIYGGTADLVNGNGIKTFGYADLGDLSWGYAGGTFRAIVSDAITPISGGDTTAICEIYNRVSYSSSISDLSFYLCANQLSASKYLVIKDDSYNGDTTAFKAGVTGKKLVYTLGTPTAFTFTGANIPTLSGVNNVYADSGDVDLEYFNENADEIAELDRAIEYHKYTTTERVVGTWIDESTVYEKTFVVNNPSTGNNTITHNISNLDMLISVGGFGKRLDGVQQPFGIISNADNFKWNIVVLDFSSTDFVLQVGEQYTSTRAISKAVVTLRYTKSST